LSVDDGSSESQSWRESEDIGFSVVERLLSECRCSYGWP
jgi:hypothetical protein